jgi:hypothetical protein
MKPKNLLGKLIGDQTYFLKYNKNPSAHKYKGDDFENKAVEILSGLNYKFSIERVGKSNDKGIDFKGTWAISSPFNVIGQCKCIQTKVPVNIIREMEGILQDFNGRNKTVFVGVIVSNNNLSPQSNISFQNSLQPLIFIWLKQQYLKDQNINFDEYLVNSFFTNNSLNAIEPKLGTATKWISNSRKMVYPTTKKDISTW